MARRSCDGAGLLRAFRAAVANLEAHVDEINGLNVFPVPDGDTGSNMVATVRAALVEADGAGDAAPAERIAAAASFGALMGARGNSGVITSQVLRGMAEGLAGKQRFNSLDLAHALSRGTRAAYGAVAKPVEGTILTVVREASEAAVAAAEQSNDLESMLAATVAAARTAVARTPSLLPILREAGVVDSGGQGFLRLLEGAQGQFAGRRPGTRRAAGPAIIEAGPPAPGLSALIPRADQGFGYETMFLLHARPGEALDVDAIRGDLERIGDSVLVAGDVRALKIHVHGQRPDVVIGYGLGLGALSRISVENLDGQTREVRETRAAAFTTEAEHVVAEAATLDATQAAVATRPPDAGQATLPLAVVAVAAGAGFQAIFRDFGVNAVVGGGESAKPSTGELMAAVRGVDAREVLLLPNDPNVVLAARQVSELADRPVAVVGTRNAAEGFAALLALDPSRTAANNAEAMTAAGRAIQSLSVTEAVRDATFTGRKVRKGQTIVLDPDDGLVAAHADRERAVLAAMAGLRPGFELVTVYYGDGATLDEAEELARRIGSRTSGVEVEVVHGGQPHYRYLIAAE